MVPDPIRRWRQKPRRPAENDAGRNGGNIGDIILRGTVENHGNMVNATCRMHIEGKPLIVNNAAFPASCGQNRLIQAYAEEALDLFRRDEQDTMHLIAAARQERGTSGTTAADETKAESGETQAATTKTRGFPWVTAANQGVKAGGIEAVLYHGENQYRGGLDRFAFTHKHYPLLKDDRMYDDIRGKHQHGRHALPP